MGRTAISFSAICHFSLALFFALLLLTLVSALPLQAGEGSFVWAQSMGGTLSDYGRGVVVDSAGNIYTTGSFQGTVDFDPGAGAFNLTSKGDADIFISKLNSNGKLVWAKSVGGTLADSGNGIAVDTAGNVYITGSFEGTVDFDPGAATFNMVSNGGADIFISKLFNNGELDWAQSIGGTVADYGNGITVDSAGNIYATGGFSGTVDFDPGAGSTDLISNGVVDIFISKLFSNGDLDWARSIGGTQPDYGRGIAVDAAHNVYTIGEFQGTVDFDPGLDTRSLTGVWDVFITKLDSNGDLDWVAAMGGPQHDNGSGIAVDIAGNVYTTGKYQEIVDFDPGPGTFNLTSLGSYSYDIFVSKLDSSGKLVWARSLGGTQDDDEGGIAIDAGDNVYITGGFQGTGDFDPGQRTFNLISKGLYDIFVSKLDSSGKLVWARSMGGALRDYGRGIAVDSESNVATTGEFEGTADFNPSLGVFNLTSKGGWDIFLSMLAGQDVFPWPMFLPAIENNTHR